MANFIRGTDNGLTPLQHSKDIFKQYLLQSYVNTMTGRKDSGKPIIVETKLGKEAGDSLRFHFIPQFMGEGMEGQNISITGNENTLEEFSMDIKIDQISQAFAKKGKMTDYRTIWDFRKEATQQLKNWFSINHERRIINALCGYSINGVDNVANPLTDRLVYGQGRLIISTGANGYDIDDGTKSPTNTLLTEVVAADKMNMDMLNALQTIALTGNEKYPMKPIRLSNGEEYYILLVHPNVAVNIRALTDWKARALSIVNAGINPEKDPIATGAIGVWNKIIIKEAHYIKTHDVLDANGKSTNKIARNLLLGGNACGVMYGQTIDYSEEYRDHKRVLSCSADEIVGRKKITFDGVDMGVAQVVTSANLK